ncbi:sensor histidine kinase [Anaeromicropila herbilytica]|uniref:histidine kinase n=1 Tax=Anaeromicropila herbilytica TaxID=2785025 RepID=A0A7R7IFC0_9FIRM|nr:sensor histidine kinase [Anaeromicropila herbilytica]BCN33019.1 hypothetical protein bsdtb5_43140 [Anaeromicropila herbilytica]
MKTSLKEFEKENSTDKILTYLSQIQKDYEELKGELANKKKETLVSIDILKKKEESLTNSIDPELKLFSPNASKLFDDQVEVHQNVICLENEMNIFEEKENNIDERLLHINEVINWCKIKGGCNSDYLFDSLGFTESVDYENFRLKLLQTQEVERNRIARDLHDTTVQNLTNIVHKTELCSKLVDIDTIRTKLELQTMISTIRTTIKDMRSIIYNLMPMSLEDLGLQISIDQLAGQIMQNNNIKVKLNVQDANIKIPSIVNLTLFRIIQESCNNIIKHARANEISIQLNYNNNNINLQVQDDGVGFELKNSVLSGNSITSNFGLSIMRERVYLLSGHINIESKRNCGTTITVKVPINNYMEE